MIINIKSLMSRYIVSILLTVIKTFRKSLPAQKALAPLRCPMETALEATQVSQRLFRILDDCIYFRHEPMSISCHCQGPTDLLFRLLDRISGILDVELTNSVGPIS